jgi:putative DNA-invertase from lambdoid prophage Rac
MFRSALDAPNTVKELKAKSVSLHLIDLGGDVAGNGISKLFFTIISAVAEAERDRIVQRILDVKTDQRRGGFWWSLGCTPVRTRLQPNKSGPS